MSQEVAVELRKIVKLLAVIATTHQDQKEKILVLSSVGFSSTEIAALVGSKAGAVRKAISRSRAKKPKTRSKKKAPRNENKS